VTENYFFAMSSVLIFQWLILYYITFIRPSLVPDDGAALAASFAIIATMYFYIQIRESHLIRITWQGIFIGNKKIF